MSPFCDKINRNILRQLYYRGEFMNYISLFDDDRTQHDRTVQFPHCRGRSQALLSRKLFQREPVKAVFTLYGSFAETYRGHGTDKAL